MTDGSQRDKMDIKPPRRDGTRVLIDLDGVVRNFVDSLIQVYNRVHPDHKVLPVNSRKLENFFPLGEDVYRFMEPGYIEEIMEDADPYPDAVEALQRWKDEFEIVIVTSQPEFSRAATYTWIGKHRIPSNEVHISHYKSEVAGFALLDDFTDNLQDFAATGRLAVCLDQAWNQSWKGPRVKTVEEFFRYVQDVLSREENKDAQSTFFA